MKRFAILLTLPLLIAACGGDDDGDDGNCIDVAGAWTLTAHCDPGMVGNDVTITQTDCAISVDWGGAVWDGTVSGSRLTVSGETSPGETLTCGGTVSGNTWSSTCSPEPCDVTVTKK